MISQCIICGNEKAKKKLTVDEFIIVKCQHCGLYFLRNPLPPAGDTETYDSYFNSAGSHTYSYDSNNEAIRNLWAINEKRLEMLKPYAGQGNILDIGSGRGQFLYHASLSGYNVEGVEISPLAAAFCEKQYGIKVYVRNIENGLETKRRYDVITMWHVLEHFMDPCRVLKKIKGLLTENGILFIEVPNIYSLKFILSTKRNKWVGGNHPRHHRYFFSTRTLSLLLSEAGYQYIKVYRQPYDFRFDTRAKNKIKKLLKRIDLDSFVNIIAER